MKTLKEYSKKTLIGKKHGENIYLSAPSWDCGWYWGFGYIGNSNCHYHIDSVIDKNLESLEKEFSEALYIAPSLRWEFVELFKTFYALKNVAEIYNRGGSHATKNPCADIIKNSNEAERINKTILPAIFDAIYDILEKSKLIFEITKKIVDVMLLDGDTEKIVQIMFENNIKTNDLKDVLTSSDYYIIHSAYYKKLHNK